MISISNLCKNFAVEGSKIKALNNIELTINAKEIFGIVGKSGAGKSTLIRCINLIEKPDSGTITINGNNINKMNDLQLTTLRQQIGMIFQNFNLLNSKTVFENISLPLEIAKIASPQIKQRVEELIALTELTELSNKYPEQLSGGQKQKVAIARALANNPNILLCDEVTSALDPYSTKVILKLLKKINLELGVTILLITHEMQVIKEICNKVAVLHNGEIVEQKDTLDLFLAPQSFIAKSFIENASNIKLPENLAKSLSKETIHEYSKLIIKISFANDVATSPILHQITHEFDIVTNVLIADLELIQQKYFGCMILEIAGKNDNIKASILFLQEKSIIVENLGYVTRDNSSYY